MRIRSTKPEFWRSERVASVSWDARLVLKGLESFVDDNGVGKDDLALIVADVFPRDLSGNPTGTLQKVSEALDHLSEAGLLWRYEVDGTRLLYVAFWESIQRIEKPAKGRLPRPDGTMEYRESTIREPSRNTPGTLRPGTGEQGNRGTGSSGTVEQDGGGLRTQVQSAPVRSLVPEMLEAAGLPPKDHQAFLQALRDHNVKRPPGWVIKAHHDADGSLEARIQEWRDDVEREAKAPRVLTSNTRPAPRDESGRVVDPELCEHGGVKGQCPMCKRGEKA